MKATKFIVGLLIVVLLASCKDDVKKPEEAKAVETLNQYKVTINAIVKQADDFQLYFSEEGYEVPFKEENSLWSHVNAGETAQDIVFIIPEDVDPTYYRLDLGVNEKQQDIQINSVTFEYLDKKVQLAPPVLFSFLLPNECVEIVDNTKGILKLKKSAQGTYDPLLFAEKAFSDELQKIKQ